jgi:hypothetical protein
VGFCSIDERCECESRRNAIAQGDRVELQFITDPAKNDDVVVIEMSHDELKRLYDRIGSRLHVKA